ncbi:hypothetical protein BGZ90_012766, partial [Linnemannia elongata]
MRLSRLSSSPTPLLITLLLLTITLSIPLHTTTASPVNFGNNKRDLLGIIPLGSSSPPPAAAPAGPPSPTTPSTVGTDGTHPNSTATGPLPGLISQVLNPSPILGSIGGVPSPTTPTKKHSAPAAGGTSVDDDGTPNDNGNPSSKAQSGNDNGPNSNGGPLSP